MIIDYFTFLFSTLLFSYCLIKTYTCKRVVFLFCLVKSFFSSLKSSGDTQKPCLFAIVDEVEKKLTSFYRVGRGLTYFDSELTLTNQNSFKFSSHSCFQNASIDWFTLILYQSRSILPKPIKGGDFSLLSLVNQAKTIVLLTVFFMLATWLKEMERRRRMQWYVNLPNIPEHAQLQPVEPFFSTYYSKRRLNINKTDKKRQNSPFQG